MVASLIDQTFTRFPQFSGLDVNVVPLEKGGSDRKFYRMEIGGAPSLILAKYGRQREENRHYVEIARFLHSAGVRVPEIHFHDDEEGLIWMEDLGNCDLWSFRDEPWAVRRPVYEDALDEALTLHTQAHAALAGTDLRLQAGFTAELYRWEQNYFLDNCLIRHFGLSEDRIEAECNGNRLLEIAAGLEALPRALVHRDFQSQNIVVKDGDACLIDFQGMREGLVQYDLASLLYDPYVSLAASERAELLSYYMERAAAAGAEVGADFRAVYDLCAMQRLMQALGAYGYLGLTNGREHFLAHIPTALASLREVVARIRGLARLGKLLEKLSERVGAGNAKRNHPNREKVDGFKILQI